MNDKAFLFEMATIALFTVAGTALLIFSLPGWGVLAIAALLSLLSLGSRRMGSRKTGLQKVNRFTQKTAMARG